MNIGSYKFYIKKYKLIFVWIFCWFILHHSIGLLSSASNTKDLVIAILAVMFFGFCTILFPFIILNFKPTLVITPEYIQIKNLEKVYWEDVVNIYEVEQYIRYTKFETLLLDVKNVEKYKLTCMQKFNKKISGYAFSLSLSLFSKKDKKEIRQIVETIRKLRKYD